MFSSGHEIAGQLSRGCASYSIVASAVTAQALRAH